MALMHGFAGLKTRHLKPRDEGARNTLTDGPSWRTPRKNVAPTPQALKDRRTTRFQGSNGPVAPRDHRCPGLRGLRGQERELRGNSQYKDVKAVARHYGYRHPRQREPLASARLASHILYGLVQGGVMLPSDSSHSRPNKSLRRKWPLWGGSPFLVTLSGNSGN